MSEKIEILFDLACQKKTLAHGFLPHQIEDGVNGFLVASPQEAAVRIVQLGVFSCDPTGALTVS